MTKKFWEDWKKRLGETKTIYRWVYYSNGCQRYNTCRMNGQDIPNRFLNFEFFGDSVEIKYEVVNFVLDENGGYFHSENRTIRLNRTDINTIKFK